MITPSFSLTATERVLPKLALDFTTASLDPRVTFTRTTDATHPATYFNSSGVLTLASNNQARFDYNPTTLTCKGLLIEESRANLALNSETFTGYTTVFSGLADSVVLSPNGSSYMKKLYEANSNNYHAINASYTVTSSAQYTMSVFAKKGERNYLQMFCGFNNISGNPYANFDLVNGVASGGGIITPVGNDIYRCSWTFTAAASSITVYLGVLDTYSGYRAYPYQGDGSSGIYIWGNQLELGAFPTSYIPTTLIPLTRNADVATMTGTNFSDWFNTSEGTLDVTYNQIGLTAYAGAFWVRDAASTASRGISCGCNGGTNFGYMRGADGSLKSLSLSTSALGSIIGMSLAYKTNFSGSANAGTVSSAVITAFPTSEAINLGFQNVAGASAYLNGHLKSFAYYPLQLTSNELKSLSKG